jgi:hypothetical protein
MINDLEVKNMKSVEPMVKHGGRVITLRQALRSAGIQRKILWCGWEEVSPRTRRRYSAIYKQFLRDQEALRRPAKLNRAEPAVYSDKPSTSTASAEHCHLPTGNHAANQDQVEVTTSHVARQGNGDTYPWDNDADDGDNESTVIDEVTEEAENPVIHDLTRLPRVEANLQLHVASANERAVVSEENSSVSVPVADILRLYQIVHQVSGAQMENLMKMFRKNNSNEEFAELPKTWRTMMRLECDSEMKTSYTVQEWGKEGSDKQRYVYIGIETRLHQNRRKYVPEGSRGPDDDPPHYEIVMNVDGAPFTDKGVMRSLWPIQIMVWAVSPAGFGTERRVLETGKFPPHLVGLHHAKTQPQDFNR